MAYTPGYYMQNGMYGMPAYPMGGNYTQPVIPQQSYAPAPPQTSMTQGIIWVDGEVGAKAYQMPAGMTGPVALWDTNDQVIYLKSMNPAGMPNPLQKVKYQIEEVKQMLPAGQQTSGHTEPAADIYVTKDDINALREEIREMLKQNQTGNQNAGQNGQIKGGNR